QTRLGHLLSPSINFVPLAFFYLLFSIGIFYFAAYPAHIRGSLMYAIGAGALLGMITYGTYDLTNMATLPGWPVSVTIVDIIWGGVVAAVSASAGYFFLS